MKKLLLFMAVCCLCIDATAGGRKQKKADNDTNKFRYEIEYIKSSGTGIVNVKVWSFSKKSSIAAEQNKKNAIHGILFKGYPGGGASQRPMIKDPSAQTNNAEFFSAFFSNGDYMQYITKVVGPVEVMKIGNEYKIAAEVTVNKDLLRQHLEKANIIRSLSSGF